MATDNLDTSALTELRSSEPQSLLDEIDSLRLQGISDFVFLPQIVVCGDQSSGKSSVLEAISGVPFPRSDALCTRNATEVILRPAPTAGAAVSIVPSQDASDADHTKLAAFKESLQGLDQFPELVEEAKAAMGISAGKAFSKHVLRVEISGPKMPKLTLVDLPGLIHSDNKQQSSADVELISDLVRSYMKNPRSVVLAVVSAKNDYANQIILKRAREVDPRGLRTLGLITKPDDLPRGSESEADYINLAGNDNIVFRLGWHVVKNRNYDSRLSSTEERDQSEKRFFSEGVWRELPRDMVGVESLRQRLSKILLEQIKRYLPNLMEDMRLSIEECEKKLLKLGDSHDTPEKQRQFLLRLSESFQTLCRAAIDGNYDHGFFGDPSSDDEYSKRLRAVVQNLNLEFSELMRSSGHRRIIKDEEKRPPTAPTVNGLTKGLLGDFQQLEISRTDAIEWVRKLLVKSRGRELPGSFNPLLVGELFRDQSIHWEKIAREHVEEIWEVSKVFLERLLDAIADHETLGALFTHWIDPNTNERFKKANQALDRLLTDRDRHPITYNHYYIESLQRVRQERQMKELERKIRSFTNASSDHIPDKQYVSISGLARSLLTSSESGIDAFACSELLDSMQAYYKVSFANHPSVTTTIFAKKRVKVALKTFVDNVSIQVVEDLLIGDLWSIFSPSDVGQMTPSLISKIAAESPESQALRQQLDRKLKTLRKGMEICQRHSTHSAIGRFHLP
jgi:GTPase SAR1 family protein